MALTLDAREVLQERIRRAPSDLIAGRIKQARQEMNGEGPVMSHDKFGELLVDENTGRPVSRQHLIKLEKAKHRPRAEMLARIAEATGRSVDWFLDSTVDSQPFPGRGDEGGDGGRSARSDLAVQSEVDGEAAA